MGYKGPFLASTAIFFVCLCITSLFAYIISKNAYRTGIDCPKAEAIDIGTNTFAAFAGLTLVSSMIGIGIGFGDIAAGQSVYSGWYFQIFMFIGILGIIIWTSLDGGLDQIGQAGGVYCILQTVGGVDAVSTGNSVGSGYVANQTYTARGSGRGLQIKVKNVDAGGALPADGVSPDNYEIVTAGSGYEQDEEVLLENSEGIPGTIIVTEVTG